MKIELRDPKVVMKLSRLGSFHQSKLSFLRSFLKEFKKWEYKKDLFELNEFGYGTAVYSLKKDLRIYSLICFADELKENERSDRVIATYRYSYRRSNNEGREVPSLVEYNMAL